MKKPERKIKYYPICEDCVKGKGKECHNPGCVYCYNDVPPEINIPDNLCIKHFIELIDIYRHGLYNLNLISEIDKEKQNEKN